MHGIKRSVTLNYLCCCFDLSVKVVERRLSVYPHSLSLCFPVWCLLHHFPVKEPFETTKVKTVNSATPCPVRPEQNACKIHYCRGKYASERKTGCCCCWAEIQNKRTNPHPQPLREDKPQTRDRGSPYKWGTLRAQSDWRAGKIFLRPPFVGEKRKPWL